MRSFYFSVFYPLLIFPTVIFFFAAVNADAQTSVPTASPANTPATAAQPTPNTVVTVQAGAVPTANEVAGPTEEVAQVNPLVRRIERARALAAAHQLQQAATELENIRVTVNDVALKNVTTLMLIGIHLEEGNYGRSQALLEESFQARSTQKDESIRTYFAMVGQTLNGIRAHVARYRSFGINPGASDLPVEANTDLERIRGLLERVVAQAREVSTEAGRSYDALALQEDVLGLRLSLARDSADREKWQADYVAVRERLASTQIQVASIGRSAALDAVTARIPNPFSAKPVEAAPGASSTASANPDSSTSAIGTAPSLTPVASEGPEPKLISTGPLSGRETKRVTPSYPALARTTGVSGTVRVFAIVDENGKVWVTNSEGPTLLRRAAEDAARGWTFPPTLVSGKPVRVAGYIDFDFKL